MTLGRVRFVLCRPRNPQNIGAAARALKCAGIASWAIVDPRTLDFEAARRVAVHAEDLLEKPRVVNSLDEALEGCVLSVGTTARARPERPLLSPREAAARLWSAPGDVAVVFGDERSGMTADEVDRVDLLSTIPASEEQSSWNLAQAVAIYAYELRAASLAPRPQSTGHAADPAALASVDRALALATSALGKPGLRRRLYRSLERAQLTGREATLWTALWRAVARKT